MRHRIGIGVTPADAASTAVCQQISRQAVCICKYEETEHFATHAKLMLLLNWRCMSIAEEVERVKIQLALHGHETISGLRMHASRGLFRMPAMLYAFRVSQSSCAIVRQ